MKIEHNKLRDIPHRYCVAGSRGFDDEKVFDSHIRRILKDHDLDTEEAKAKIVFITGNAPSGADKLIIDWCKANGYNWCEFDAPWDDVEAEGAVIKNNPRTGKPYNVLAGFWRNEEMAEAMTYLITFYDGVSPGTSDMIERAVEHQVPRENILVPVKEKRKWTK
jgi:hypothetical protein